MRTAALAAIMGTSFVLACGDSGNGPPNAGDAQAQADASANADGSGSGVANGDSGNGDAGSGGSGGSGGNESGGGGGDANLTDAKLTDTGSNDASGDGNIGDVASADASRSCHGTTCAATEACVAYRVIGGARLVPDDAGHCMAGAHVEGTGSIAFCAADFAYRCMPLVGCGSMPVSCSCAVQTGAEPASTCPAQYPTCFDPTASSLLDPAAQLVCELLAP